MELTAIALGTDHATAAQTLDGRLQWRGRQADLLLNGSDRQGAFVQQRLQDAEVSHLDSLAGKTRFKELGERAIGAAENEHELWCCNAGCLRHAGNPTAGARRGTRLRRFSSTDAGNRQDQASPSA